MTGPYVLALLAVLLAWACLSAWVIVERAVYDRAVSALRTGSKGRRLRWRTVARIATDSSSDPELAAALARSVLETDERRVVTAAHDARTGWRRIEAVRILALADHPLSLPLLERMLQARDKEVSAAALTMLGEMGHEEATLLLIDSLRTGVCAPRWASALLDRRVVSTGLLVTLLDDPRSDVRAVATRLLAKADDPTARVEGILLGLCRDQEADVRAAACRALGERGSASGVQPLESMLADPVWFVQVRAARALAQLHSLGSARKIAELMASRRWWVRQAAKDALVDLGPSVKEPLLPLLDHPDPFARNSCAEVLQNLGVVEELVAWAKNGSNPARASAASVLLRKILEAGGSRFQETVVGSTGPLVSDAPEVRAA